MNFFGLDSKHCTVLVCFTAFTGMEPFKCHTPSPILLNLNFSSLFREMQNPCPFPFLQTNFDYVWQDISYNYSYSYCQNVKLLSFFPNDY